MTVRDEDGKFRKQTPFEKNKHEIIYNLINSGLAGGLVFFGSLTSGGITLAGCGSAFVASAIVFITKFKHYLDGEKGEYSSKVFNWI